MLKSQSQPVVLHLTIPSHVSYNMLSTKLIQVRDLDQSIFRFLQLKLDQIRTFSPIHSLQLKKQKPALLGNLVSDRGLLPLAEGLNINPHMTTAETMSSCQPQKTIHAIVHGMISQVRFTLIHVI